MAEKIRSKRAPRAGTRIVWPKGLEEQLGISAPTRWRWERDKKLPPRDAFIDGKPKGWRPETLDAVLNGSAT